MVSFQKSARPRLPSEAQGQAAPLELLVRVNVESITEISTVAQTFKAQIFIVAKVPGGARRPDLKTEEEGEDAYSHVEMTYFRAFDFLNAREDIVEKYRSLKTDDDDLIMQLRVVGTFANRMDFGNFPLDTQELQIQFTVNNSNEGKAPVCLVPLLKESKIHESLFVLGSVWNLLSALTFEIKDSDPILSGRNRTYPIMVISMKVQRRSGYYMWNVALPMLSFVVMAFMSHWIPAEDAAGRLSVSVALVLAAAAYKVVLAQMLPAISYVTMLDNYVMWCCFFLFLTVVENGVMSIQERRAYDGLVFGLLASVFALTTLFYALKVFKLAWWRNRQREESMIHWIRKAPSKKLFQILPVSPGTGPEQD